MDKLKKFLRWINVFARINRINRDVACVASHIDDLIYKVNSTSEKITEIHKLINSVSVHWLARLDCLKEENRVEYNALHLANDRFRTDIKYLKTRTTNQAKLIKAISNQISDLKNDIDGNNPNYSDYSIEAQDVLDDCNRIKKEINIIYSNIASGLITKGV